jgi:hypothetical protein
MMEGGWWYRERLANGREPVTLGVGFIQWELVWLPFVGRRKMWYPLLSPPNAA